MTVDGTHCPLLLPEFPENPPVGLGWNAVTWTDLDRDMVMVVAAPESPVMVIVTVLKGGKLV